MALRSQLDVERINYFFIYKRWKTIDNARQKKKKKEKKTTIEYLLLRDFDKKKHGIYIITKNTEYNTHTHTQNKLSLRIYAIDSTWSLPLTEGHSELILMNYHIWEWTKTRHRCLFSKWLLDLDSISTQRKRLKTNKIHQNS